MDAQKDFNIRLEENNRTKWQATINVEIELAKTFDKSISSYIG